MIVSKPEITAANAGWRTQFCTRGGYQGAGLAEFVRRCYMHMHWSALIRLQGWVAIAVMFQLSVSAGTVRLSFLNDPATLQETVALLIKSGCSECASSIFKHVAEHYYGAGFDFDYSRFPKPQNGFYSFTNARELVAALPQRLSDTKHAWDFNCFDTVIVLADGRLRTRLRPVEIVGPLMISTRTTNNEEVITFAATARDAFTQMVQPWYREATESTFPESMRDTRICLTAQLFRWHLLPLSASEEKLEKIVMTALQTKWRQEKLSFPSGFEVVLCHKADLPAHTICTSHAGVLFGRKRGYTFLEKAGGSGPFVRLDFDERPELLFWLSSKFDETEHRYAHIYATFNNTRIENLDTK